MPMLVDGLDRKILDILRRDARASYRSIARSLGVTTPTVIARVRKLEGVGVIVGYSVKVRGEPFHGLLFVLDSKRARGLKQRLERIEGVTNVMTASGGGLIALVESGAEAEVGKACRSGGARFKVYRITSPVTHHRDVKALCAYCRQPMDDALRVTLGKRQYYICCPVCARSLRERFEKMSGKAGGSS